MPLELIPKVTYRRRDRPGSRVTQRADGITFDLTLDIPEQIDIAFLSFTAVDVLQRILYHPRVFVEYDKSTRAHHRALWKTAVGKPFVVHHPGLALYCL